MLHFTMLHILASTSLLLNTAVGLIIINIFLHYLPTVLYGIISGEYPGHFRTVILLYSRHVLVLLELYHEERSCIKIYPFCGHITRSH